MITHIALSSAVRAALAVELLRDLLEADVVDAEMVVSGSLLPSDVLRLHGDARAGGKRFRPVGQFLDEVDAGVLAPIQDMRDQLRRLAVTDDEFESAVRGLLRSSAQ
jgi:hypothetical protein